MTDPTAEPPVSPEDRSQAYPSLPAPSLPAPSLGHPPPDSPPSSYPTPAQGYPAQATPAQGYPAQTQAYPAQVYPANPTRQYPAQVFPPTPGAPSPAGQDHMQWPAAAPPAPRRKRRTGLIVSLSLIVIVMLCAGGGITAYFYILDAQPRGQTAPKAAIEGFLTAVFTDHSAQAAAAYVCPAARDEAELARLVSQVKTFAEKFDTPRTTWTYDPVSPSGTQAEVTVTLLLETANEQVATKDVRLLLVEHRGWWVCDAESA